MSERGLRHTGEREPPVTVLLDDSALTFLLVFVLGAIVGSFLNVCIVRLPRGESLLSPPSHCPHFKTAIPFYDNIPLISYSDGNK